MHEADVRHSEVTTSSAKAAPPNIKHLIYLIMWISPPALYILSTFFRLSRILLSWKSTQDLSVNNWVLYGHIVMLIHLVGMNDIMGLDMQANVRVQGKILNAKLKLKTPPGYWYEPSTTRWGLHCSTNEITTSRKCACVNASAHVTVMTRLWPIMLKNLPIILFFYAHSSAYYSSMPAEQCLLF